MHIIVLTPRFTRRYKTVLECFDTEPVKILHVDSFHEDSPSAVLDEACGVFISSGETPSNQRTPEWGKNHFELMRFALDMDLPVLASQSGIHLINQLCGGKGPKPVLGHNVESTQERFNSITHSIYLSPGSKSAAILGIGGFFKVNSDHYYGISEIDRARDLLASAYSVEDGVIEGLESPQHSWVIAFQTNLENLADSPTIFKNLFLGFIDRAKALQMDGRV